MNDKNRDSWKASVRMRAEERLKQQLRDVRPLTEEDIQRLLNEIGTYQIELEIQNEDLRRNQRELEAARDKFEKLYDFSPLGYFTFDYDYRVLSVNLAGAAILGLPRSRIIGRKFSHFVHGDSLLAFRSHVSETCLAKSARIVEIRIVREDSSFFYAELHSRAVNDPSNDGPLCQTAVIDISDRIRAEDLKCAQDKIQAAYGELESFSYSLSHDLRAPVRQITSFAELLKKRLKDYPDATAQQHVSSIISAGLRMGDLIDDILEFSRLGLRQLQLKRVGFHKLARDVMDELLKETQGRDIKWNIGDLPDVYGDKAMLRQVLVNLISNALKFTAGRNQALVEIGHHEVGSEHVFFISDNGAGFDMQYSDRLFGVFQRLHTQSEFEGTGIGLANVRRIISRHGGRTWAEASVGKGATFYFSLPLNPAPPDRGAGEQAI